MVFQFLLLFYTLWRIDLFAIYHYNAVHASRVWDSQRWLYQVNLYIGR